MLTEPHSSGDEMANFCNRLFAEPGDGSFIQCVAQTRCETRC